MTQEEFEKFIKQSGLKKGHVASMIGVPQWVLSAWLKNKTMLWEYQQYRLDEFCKSFCEHNNYMNENDDTKQIAE